ncbi:PIN domain nuclease [Gordonibacter sp. 28C]|uniref:type II toxin-antitoxin system VapC family toxin n=1 Tax=Gordonibacter sp. 28C TaxID=2078569 RepID=UPI000DF78CF6|nr:PIN domain-containing protein [Gordonibacter sp. 28C]RDB63362.1 PIN domain nuclease [Gordonibacter sp. 28C]
MGALVDTNVVIDALADRGEWADDAKSLLFLASQGKAHLAVSGSTLTDIYYLVNRYVYHDKARSLQVVSILLDSLSVADVGFGECLRGAHSGIRDFEDAVVAEAARRAGLDYIVTRNERDYRGSEVPVISPGAYLKKLLG